MFDERFLFRSCFRLFQQLNISDLYQLIANNEGVDHKKLALLLYDIIHVALAFSIFIKNLCVI